jgi:hypothetical protein
MLYRIKGATARHQWERHCRNWRKGKHHAWQDGKYVGDAPAGFSRNEDGTISPNEHAPAIREAFRVKADGGTWLEVANVLTAAGVSTSGGYGKKGTTKWRRESVRSVIERRVYFGLHACTCGCGEEVIRPEWDILTDPDQEPGAGKRLWRKAQPTTDDLGKVRHRGEGHALGGGLIRCSTCGVGLIKSSTRGGKYHQMRCPGRGGGHPSITYSVALEHVVLAATEHFGGFNYSREEGSNAAEVEEARARLQDARAELAEVEEMLGTRAPEDSRQRVAVEEAEDALAALDRMEGDTRLYALQPYQMRDIFETMDAAAQRKALRALGVSRVVLSPGRRPVAERLSVEFSDGTTWTEPEHDPVDWPKSDPFSVYEDQVPEVAAA